MLPSPVKFARSVFVLTGLCIGSAFSQAPQAVLNVRPSAVQILLTKADDKGVVSTRAICTGTSVLLPEGRRILTAGHCVLPENAGDKTFVGGTFSILDYKGRVWPMKVERAELDWPRNDYAVVHSIAQYVLPPLKVAKVAPKIGDDVFSWSGPMGLDPMLFHGEMSGQLHVPYDEAGEGRVGGMWYSSNLAVAPGASGSSVLNSSGEVTGILVGGFSPSVKLAGAFFAPTPPLLK